MPTDADFTWVFRTPFPEQTPALVETAQELAGPFDAILHLRRQGQGWLLRAAFTGDPDQAEERGRAFWLELHSRCLDLNLGLELVEDDGAEPDGWLAPEAFQPQPPRLVYASSPPAAALARQRVPIAEEPLYDILRAGDPEMDANLAHTITWIESQGLPVVNLLSYLDLPLFTTYAAAHPDERDQNLFLHMLHTWTCYRRFGALHARLPEELAATFTDARYLRINTTQFRSPAPALCLQFVDWTQPVRGVGAGPTLWAKEIYLTHCEPPTPADDRELTLMIVTCDENGEFGFIPLEIPLSLPAVDQSIEAFFAPGAGDEDWAANAEDLCRLTRLVATWCLYASVRDPARYLQA
ncbi:MAG: hypothetical protein ACTHJX_07845 [Terriglobales bacterium]